jgi:DNA processing protein
LAERRVSGSDAEDGEAASAGRVLSDAERLDWVRLIRSETIGPVTFHELIDHFGSAGAAIEAIPELSRRGGARQSRRIASRSEAERELEAAAAARARLVLLRDDDYPPLLRHIPDPPPLLYIRGSAELAARPVVGIVGSRDASAAGRQFTADLARELGAAGIVVASGLARGIDTAAHDAALATGTIAAIAGGIDIVYPPENRALHEAIAERGLLVTECPPGFIPRGQDFPRRNRIISGVSSAVAIVEAAQRSGSLITARLALEQGREVFAVPGHPLDPRAAGTNGLIKSGANILTSAEDILGELSASLRIAPRFGESGVAPHSQPAAAPLRLPEHPASPHDQILAALSFTPVRTDILLRQTGLSARYLAVALLELDLAGRIERHRDDRVSLKPVPSRHG